VTAPRLVVLTDRRASEARGRTLVRTVGLAVDAGAPAVLLREKDLPPAERRDLAAALLAVVRPAGARLLVASDAGLAAAVGADGVHLAAADPLPGVRDRGWVVGRSCHTPAEVRAAAADALDHVTISPVASTASKPGYGPPIGADGVTAAVVAAGDLPVLALGGVTPTNARSWFAAGAYGVAVMGAVMAADDPGACVRTLLAARPTETA
jgi:thiamine-phosphate pyrophosphorylase